MHKEAQQATGGPTSLGATTDSTAEADPGLYAPNDSIPSQQDQTKSARDGLKTAQTDSGIDKESRADEIIKKIKLEDLSDLLKDTRSIFFTLDSPQDEPIIVLDKIEGEEVVAKDKDSYASSHDVPKDTSNPHPPSPKSAQIQELMAQARPLYPDVNQLTTLLVTSLKPELSKLLALHNFASHLPTELKELPSKFTELSGEIKDLKQHVKDMEIELPRDLKEIPTKLETFTSTISIQKQLKTLDSLPSLLNKVIKTLNGFAIVVENALEAMTKDVPSSGQATASPAEGEKNTTKDAETNLQNELVNLLGIDVVEQYHNKKLLFDKYYDKMLKRRKSSKIINCDVITQNGPIYLKKDELEQQKAKAETEVASLKARPLYPDVNQLTTLLVTSLKPELSKLLALHNFASHLPTELKELPSKFTELSGEIKDLKQHVKDMEIELPRDLKEIPTKLETFTSTISIQKQLKTLDSLPSLLNKVIKTLNGFAIVVENALEAMTKDVPSSGQATASPAEGEKNTTKDAETNLQNELVNLLGIDVLESLKVLQRYLFRSLEDWEVSSLQFTQWYINLRRTQERASVHLG
ncbi:hypothetical protein Tco_0294735 [Tanacetum coccineum]